MWALGAAPLFRRPDQMRILRTQVVASDFASNLFYRDAEFSRDNAGTIQPPPNSLLRDWLAGQIRNCLSKGNLASNYLNGFFNRFHHARHNTTVVVS